MSFGWGGLETLVVLATQLQATIKADVLAHVSKEFHRFKLYARRMLTALDVVRRCRRAFGHGSTDHP